MSGKGNLSAPIPAAADSKQVDDAVVNFRKTPLYMGEYFVEYTIPADEDGDVVPVNAVRNANGTYRFQPRVLYAAGDLCYAEDVVQLALRDHPTWGATIQRVCSGGSAMVRLIAECKSDLPCFQTSDGYRFERVGDHWENASGDVCENHPVFGCPMDCFGAPMDGDFEGATEWIIVTEEEDGTWADCGEGPFTTAAYAQEYGHNEVGVDYRILVRKGGN